MVRKQKKYDQKRMGHTVESTRQPRSHSLSVPLVHCVLQMGVGVGGAGGIGLHCIQFHKFTPSVKSLEPAFFNSGP